MLFTELVRDLQYVGPNERRFGEISRPEIRFYFP
jgi:hypothetical protein